MSQNAEGKNFFVLIFKSVILSVLITLLSVIVFAFIVKRAGLTTTVIKSVNQFIKTVSVFVGCFFVIKGRLGVVKGAVSGALYALIIALLFFLFSKTSYPTFSLAIEVAFCLIIGAISGVVAVNKKN